MPHIPDEAIKCSACGGTVEMTKIYERSSVDVVWGDLNEQINIGCDVWTDRKHPEPELKEISRVVRCLRCGKKWFNEEIDGDYGDTFYRSILQKGGF